MKDYGVADILIGYGWFCKHLCGTSTVIHILQDLPSTGTWEHMGLSHG